MEDEERKATFFKTSYGDWKDWTIPIGMILVVFGIMLVISIPILIGTIIGDYYEVKAFNRIHGTDYTLGEWFWAENTIEDYHLGTVENINVDLNIKGLKGGQE